MRIHDTNEDIQYSRMKSLRGALTHRPANRHPSANRQSGLYGFDFSISQPSTLENAVRIARIARDRLLAASREEQRIYRSLLSAEGALRDAGGMLLESLDEAPLHVDAPPPVDAKELEGGRSAPRTWAETAVSSSSKAVRLRQPAKDEGRDGDGLRDVLEQVCRHALHACVRAWLCARLFPRTLAADRCWKHAPT